MSLYYTFLTAILHLVHNQCLSFLMFSQLLWYSRNIDRFLKTVYPLRLSDYNPRANKMLYETMKVLELHDERISTHVFSKMPYCGKCGMLLTSGLDPAKKDGYRHSRYTCSTNSQRTRITAITL